MKNRRRGATPFYKDQCDRDHLLLIACTFVTGCMAGASMVLGFVL